MATTTGGLFPNVPDLPGVPPLARKVGSVAIASTPLFIKDILPKNTAKPTWGIFDKVGNLAINPDSFLGLSHRNDNRVSDYPVEEGAFATYNKVQSPFETTISLTKGGSVTDRTKFLLSVESVFNSMDLFTIITPELTYENVTVTHYEYERRSKNGSHFIVTHIHFMQVRVLPNPGVYASPTATPSQHRGQVSGKSLTSQVLAASSLSVIANW